MRDSTTTMMRKEIEAAKFNLEKQRRDFYGLNAARTIVGKLGVPCGKETYRVIMANRKVFNKMAKSEKIKVTFAKPPYLYYQYVE